MAFLDREMPWPENAPAVPAFPPSLAVRRHFPSPQGSWPRRDERCSLTEHSVNVRSRLQR